MNNIIIPNGQVYFAPTGTPIDDLTQWKEVGHLQPDGYIIHDDGLPISASPVRTGWSSVIREINFSASMRNSRAVMKLLWGTYRLPGDKPLIHNGRRAR